MVFPVNIPDFPPFGKDTVFLGTKKTGSRRICRGISSGLGDHLPWNVVKRLDFTRKISFPKNRGDPNCHFYWNIIYEQWWDSFEHVAIIVRPANSCSSQRSPVVALSRILIGLFGVLKICEDDWRMQKYVDIYIYIYIYIDIYIYTYIYIYIYVSRATWDPYSCIILANLSMLMHAHAMLLPATS